MGKDFAHTKLMKEAILMGNKANQSIACSVQQCMHHCGDKNYCSLDCISVGTHEVNPTEVQCVDCESFRLK